MCGGAGKLGNTSKTGSCGGSKNSQATEDMFKKLIEAIKQQQAEKSSMANNDNSNTNTMSKFIQQMMAATA